MTKNEKQIEKTKNDKKYLGNKRKIVKNDKKSENKKLKKKQNENKK